MLAEQFLHVCHGLVDNLRRSLRFCFRSNIDIHILRTRHVMNRTDEDLQNIGRYIPDSLEWGVEHIGGHPQSLPREDLEQRHGLVAGIGKLGDDGSE